MYVIKRTDTRYLLSVLISSDSPKADQYLMGETFRVELFDGRTVDIRWGFVSDIHSTPPCSQSILPAYNSRTALAAILHDYLYMHWEETGLIGAGPYEHDRRRPGYNNRAYADRCYFELMQQFNRGHWRNYVYYAAVRLFGWLNWRQFRLAAINRSRKNFELK